MGPHSLYSFLILFYFSSCSREFASSGLENELDPIVSFFLFFMKLNTSYTKIPKGYMQLKRNVRVTIQKGRMESKLKRKLLCLGLM